MAKAKRHIAVIMDDDAIFAKEMHDFLSGLCFEVLTCNSYEDLVVLIEGRIPAAIVLSAELKSENGYLVCRKIRKNTSWADCQVFITSAAPNADRDFKKHSGVKYPANGYFKKPITLMDFAEANLGKLRLPPLAPLPELATRSEEVLESAKSLKEAEASIHTLETQLTELKANEVALLDKASQLDELRKEHKSAAKKIDDLQSSMESLEKEKSNAETSVDELQKNLALAKDQEQDLRKQIENLIQEKNQQSENNNELVAKLEKLKSEGEVTQEKLRNFYKKKLTDVESERDAALTKATKTEELQEKMDKFKVRIKAMRDEIRKAADDYKKVEDELEKERAFRKRISSALQD